MDGHIIEVIGVTSLLVFAGTMFYQGTLVIYEQRGYSQRHLRRDSFRMRQRLEELIKDETYGKD